VEAAGLRFNQVEDLRAGAAVFHDFTNELLIERLERGEKVDLRSPEQAGEVLAGIVSANQFTLYEYFITDKIGHAQDRDAARRVLPMLARFIRALLGKVDLARSTVILTSDHGNIEDLSVRNHTLNPVPTIVWGRHREHVAPRIRSLTDITPAIVEVLTKGFETNGELDNTGRAFAQN
jgi:bisphosphoglycerate-independent phosphoglycerate mutase (AlkP superfamily)